VKSREDWLCDQLDKDDISQEMKAKYEQELDAIARSHTKRQEAEKKAIAERTERFAHIKAQLIAGDINVIDAFGIPEFGDDYETVIEGNNYVVYSKVASDNQNNRHVMNTADEANSKFRKLVWDRLYHKYVRTGEVDNLSELAS
jgi:hypothetical protein